VITEDQGKATVPGKKVFKADFYPRETDCMLSVALACGSHRCSFLRKPCTHLFRFLLRCLFSPKFLFGSFHIRLCFWAKEVADWHLIAQVLLQQCLLWRCISGNPGSSRLQQAAGCRESKVF